MSLLSSPGPPGPSCQPPRQLASAVRPDEPEPWEPVPGVDFQASQPADRPTIPLTRQPGVEQKVPLTRQPGVEQKVQQLESLAELLHRELSALRVSLDDNPHANVPELSVHTNGTFAVASHANELSGARDPLSMYPYLGDSQETSRKVSTLQVPQVPPSPVAMMQVPQVPPSPVSTDADKVQIATSSQFIGQMLRGSPHAGQYLKQISWRDAMHTFGGVVIVLHIVCIGYTTEYSIQGTEPRLLRILEHLFLVYYIAEMIIFLYVDGWRTCFDDRWFCFDMLLVVIAIFSQWLFPLVVYLTTDSGEVIGLEKALIIRILRLGRLLRALRVIESFKDLWKLVAGILRSTRTVLSACLLIFITLYVFALVGVEVVRKSEKLLDDETTRLIILAHFDSVFGVLLTLVQFANADSIASLYDPIIRVQPNLVLYFGGVWVVVTILLMNLVTAVVIQNAIDLGAEDAEEQAKERRRRLEKMVPLLKEAFELADTSSDGQLQIEEVDALCKLPLPRELQMIMAKERMHDLFRCLDTDETGSISMDEFVKGICQIALSEVPIETTQILSMLRVQSKALDELQHRITEKVPLGSCTFAQKHSGGRL